MFLVKHIFNTTIILFYLASVKSFVNNNFVSPEINIHSDNILLHSIDPIKNENKTCDAIVKDYYHGFMNPIGRVRKYPENNFEKSTPLSARYRITRERKLYLDDVSKMETSRSIMPLLYNRKQITRTILMQRSNENRITNRREIRMDNSAERYKTRNSEINERRQIDNRNLIDVEDNKRFRTMQYRVDRRNSELLSNANRRTRDNRISSSNNAKSDRNNNRFSMERNVLLERTRSNDELPIDRVRTINNNKRSRTLLNDRVRDDTLRVRSIEATEERQLQNKNIRQREFPSRNEETFNRIRSTNKIDRSEQKLSTNSYRRVDRRSAEILTDSNRRTRETNTRDSSNNAKSETNNNRILIDRNLLLERTRSKYEVRIDRMRTISNERSRNVPNNAGVRDSTLRIRSIGDIEKRQLENERRNQKEFTRNDESLMFNNRAYRADDRRRSYYTNRDLKSNTGLYNRARRSLKDIDSNDVIRNRRVIERRVLHVREQKIDNEKIVNASVMEIRNVREREREMNTLSQRVRKLSNREETERLSCDKASSGRLRREPVNVIYQERRNAKKDQRILEYRTTSVLDDVENAVISAERNNRVSKIPINVENERNSRERYVRVSARHRVVERKSSEVLLDTNRERKTRDVTGLFRTSYLRNQVSEEREHITPNYRIQVFASFNRVIPTNDRVSYSIRSRSLSERYSQNRKASNTADYSYINQASRISKDLMHRVTDYVQPTRDRTIQSRDRMLTERKNPSGQRIILNSADRKTIINDNFIRNTHYSYNMFPNKDTTIDRRNSVILNMDNSDRTLSVYRYRKGSTVSRFVQDNYSKYDMWQFLNTNLHWINIAKLLLTILPLLQIYRSSANAKTLYPDERTNYGLF